MRLGWSDQTRFLFQTALCTGRKLWDPGWVGCLLEFPRFNTQTIKTAKAEWTVIHSPEGDRSNGKESNEWFQTLLTRGRFSRFAPVARMTSAPHLSFGQSDHRIRALIRLHSKLKVSWTPRV